MLDGSSEGIEKKFTAFTFSLRKNGSASHEKNRASPHFTKPSLCPPETRALAWTSKFAEPGKARGFWVIADGDNMQSQFTTTIKEL